MLYVKINQGNVELPLLNEKELRTTLSEYSLPKKLTDVALEPFGYVCVDTMASELKQTSSEMYNFTVSLIDGKYTRQVSLVTASPEEAANRWTRKKRANDSLVKKLLAQTEFVLNQDYFFQVNEYMKFRSDLNEILNSQEDPFTVVFPKMPIDLSKSTTLEDKKTYKKQLLKANFLKKSRYPDAVETGLGYSVDASYTDKINFEIGKKQGITTVRDSNNVSHNVTSADYDIIINAIEASGINLYTKKWSIESSIDSAATIEDLDLVDITL